MSLAAGVTTLLSFFDGISRDDDRELLPRIQAQTLILSSTAGLEVLGGVGLYLRDRIPRAHLAELPGGDHFAFARRPVLVNLLIEQALPEPHAGQ